MSINPPQYDLELPEAIARLKEEAAKHEAQPPDPLLEGIDVDTAWVLGYQTAIQDLESLTGPNPREVGLIIATPREEGSA